MIEKIFLNYPINSLHQILITSTVREVTSEDWKSLEIVDKKNSVLY